MNTAEIIPLETVGQKIFIISGMKVMLGQDLAELYQIPVKVLTQSVKRNIDRFPPDFMFQLTAEEFKNLKSQIVTSSWGGARRALPYVFTEHGVAMLAAVLRSQRAVQMSVYIIRAFVKLRELLATNKELAARIELLEKEQEKQGEDISDINRQLQKLMSQPLPARGEMGFKRE